MAETLMDIVAGHQSGDRAIADTVERVFQRLEASADPAIFISIRERDAIAADIRAVEGDDTSLPLYGVPVAIKDNIDVAGLPTTAACPAFSYMPERDAEAVSRLKRAGAIVIGKTNLDQFATGLVGMRSPYGMPRNPLRSDLISGGSSSGSAVAVARGIVPLALGTDTAGSGRVPAGLNNIVGLKPSLGLVSTRGVVPACRSLDCVSIFALTAEDAFSALSAIAAPDSDDAFSRPLPLGPMPLVPTSMRIGIPRPEDRIFLGDAQAADSFATACHLAQTMGATLVEVDLTPLFDAVKLLYDGPWVAERTAAVGEFISRHPGDVHPITKAIIEQGTAKSAVETFRGLYRLAELRGAASKLFASFDALMVPTFPKPCTVAEVEADPIGANSLLGTYTNFVNLLDLAGIAVPVSLASDGTAHGATLLGPAGRDAYLASLGGALHRRSGLALGALGARNTSAPPCSDAPAPSEVEIVVVGAHLSGMPLNGELRALSARFLSAIDTAADYRLFALAGTQPAKPGLLRVAAGAGTRIAVETWALSVEAFGKFVSSVPAPLSIGTVRLADGRGVKGFLVEAEAVTDARDVSAFGGWRAFVAAQSPR